jgi:hypothetical protein
MSIRSKSSNPGVKWDKSKNPLQASARSTAAILVFFLLAFGWSWTIGYAAAQAVMPDQKQAKNNLPC